MKKYKWYSLPALPTLLVVAAAAALLFFVFRTGNFGPLAYVSYLLSTYALVVGVSGLIRFFPWVGQAIPNTRLMRTLHRNAHAAREIEPGGN